MINDQNSPSTHGSNGASHDSRGRFKPGNKLGKGNPLAGRAAKIRAILLQSLTDTDAEAIALKLIELAKSGDLAATKELFDRCIGKPAQSDILERIETIEKTLMPANKSKE